MSKLRPLKSAEVLGALPRVGFQRIRQKGSHVRLRHPDGHVVTVAHDLGRGLLRKILRDAELEVDEFLKLL